MYINIHVLQMFSRISIALAKQNAVTLPDLLRVIHNTYDPTPIICTVENIYNVKDWLRDYTSKFRIIFCFWETVFG